MESSLRTQTDFRLLWRETEAGRLSVFAGYTESYMKTNRILAKMGF